MVEKRNQQNKNLNSNTHRRQIDHKAFIVLLMIQEKEIKFHASPLSGSITLLLKCIFVGFRVNKGSNFRDFDK